MFPSSGPTLPPPPIPDYKNVLVQEPRSLTIASKFFYKPKWPIGAKAYLRFL